MGKSHSRSQERKSANVHMVNIGNRFFNDVKIYSMNPIINKFIAILLIPLYTSYLSTEEYGRISYILMIGTIFITVTGIGLGSAFWKYYKSTTNIEEKSEIVYITMHMQIIAGIAFIALLYALSIFINIDDCNLIAIYLAGLTINRVYEKGMALLRANHKAKKYIAISTLVNVTRVLLIMMMVIVFVKGYNGVIKAHLYNYIIATVIGIMLIKGNIKKSTNAKLKKKMILFSIPLMFGSLSSVIMNTVDKLSVNAYLGKADLGLYSFALNFGLLIKVFILAPFFLAWSPLRWELYNSGTGRDEKFSQITKLVVVGFCVFGIAIGVMSMLAAEILSQDESYMASQDIIPLIALTQAIWGLYSYELMGFYFSGKTKKIPILILILGIVNIILNIALIPIIGYRGAALATIISYYLLRYITARISSSLYKYKRSIEKETILISVAAVFSILLGRVSLLFGINIAIILMIIAIAIILVIAWKLSMIDNIAVKKIAKLFKKEKDIED